MTDYTWSSLIERAKRDDQDAFYALYQNSYDAVYRTVKSMVRDEDAALDIVQDAYVKGFATLDALDNPDSFVPWMKRVATNKAKDWFKKRHDIAFSDLSDDDGGEPDFEDDRQAHLPETVIDRNETARLIDEILSTLSDEQRIAVGMYYYEEMSVTEIARLLSVSEGTVKSRLNYGRKKIKAGVEALEKQGTQLYSLAPSPFFLWLLRGQQAQTVAWQAPAGAFSGIMAQMHGAAAASAGAASAGAASGAASAGSGAASTGVGSSVAAGAAAGKTGLLASTGAKIVAGLLGAVLLAEAGVAGYLIYQRATDRTPDEPETVQSQEYEDEDEPPTPPVEDEPPVEEEPEVVLPPEELLTQYLEQALIAEKGIYEITQTGYWEGGGWLNAEEVIYDAATGELSQRETNAMNSYSDYQAALQNKTYAGLDWAELYDYDADGEPELFAVYGERNERYMEMFDVADGEVTSVGKASLEDLSLHDGWLQEIRRFEQNGTVYIIVYEKVNSGGTDPDLNYYRFSGTLELLSSLKIESSYYLSADEMVTEYFYDTGTQINHPVTLVEHELWESNFPDVVYDYGHGYEAAGVERLCRFYNVGVELNDFFREYYGKEIPDPDADDAE